VETEQQAHAEPALDADELDQLIGELSDDEMRSLLAELEAGAAERDTGGAPS
jgi:hypothetical protein